MADTRGVVRYVSCGGVPLTAACGCESNGDDGGSTAHVGGSPVSIPLDEVLPAALTSSITRPATPTTGSSAHVVSPDVNHICRIPGYVRRATDTEHGNHTLCCDECFRTDGRFHTSVCDAADYDLNVSSSSTVSTPVGTNDTNDFIPGWHNYNFSGKKLDPISEVHSSNDAGSSLDAHSPSNVFSPHRGGASGATVLVASSGGSAFGATRGMRDGAGGHGGSVGTPLASSGDGDSQPCSLGAARTGSLDVRSSSNVFTPHRGGAPGAAVSVASDGDSASGVTHELRDGACGHGSSVGVPLTSFGDGDSQPRSLGAARAGSLDVRSSSNSFTPHRGDAPGATASVPR